MILVHANLFVCATFADAPEHGHPVLAGSSACRGGGSAVLAWSVLYAFLRLMTSRRVFGTRALTVRRAWEVVTA